MSERITPTKVERRSYYHQAAKAAEFILLTRAQTHELGKRRTKKFPLSPRESTYSQKLTLDLMEFTYPALPLVIVELVKPDLRQAIQDDRDPLEINTLTSGFSPEIMADGLTILSTGLNRRISAAVDGLRLPQVQPDTSPKVLEEHIRMKLGQYARQIG